MNWHTIFILMLFFNLPAGNIAKATEPVAIASLSNSSFKDLWQAIIIEAGINANFVTASRNNRRDALVNGTLAMDCCSIPAWRATEAERAVQLYTDPIFYATDHLILQQGRDYDLSDSNDLSAYKIAVVKGFSYVGEDSFVDVIEVLTMDETFELVASGKADLTIANSQEFWRRLRLKPNPLKLGPIHDQVLLRARVHKNWAELLPRVNDAIKRLRKSGQMDMLLARRIRDIQGPGSNR